MDEGKLKEDDWLSEVSSAIGEQIEQECQLEPSENSQEEVIHEDTVTNNDINNKDDDVAEENRENTFAEDQVSTQEEDAEVEAAECEEKETPNALEDYLNQANHEEVQEERGKKKWSWKRKLLVVFCVLAVLVGGVFVFVYAMLGKIDKETPDEIRRAETDLTDEELAAQQATLTPQMFDDTIEQQVVNILLIGEEAMSDDVGRSDSMMVATLNTVEKSIKLTSFMRDMYVTIPGYANNKLNAAYHNGGGVLLAETIEQNFGIEIDGYVRVDFNAFEDIVNKLKGVDIELTSDEAHYLNTTNYISNPAYRNVTAGWNTLNGNQALGYCRVRYKSASNGEANDFGRTYRQRTVLKAIFDKYKSQNVVSMISIATDLLSYVTTNLSKADIISYISTFASFGTLELETFRVPMDNTYAGEKVNGKAVLVVDFDTNKTALRNFIYAGIEDEDIQVESNDMEDEQYFHYLWTD